MSNVIYPKAKSAFLMASVNMSTDTIKCALVTNSYTYNSGHQYLSDLGGFTVGSDQILTGITISNGAFSASNVAFTSLSSTATVNALVIYKSSGTSSTSPLLAYLDSGTGLPIGLGSVSECDVSWGSSIFTL